jgi:RimJ/RimL family protein N-acetyltransferase
MFPELTRDDVFMIGTKRLWLRWPMVADAAELARLSGDPRVASLTASWPIGATEAFARRRIDGMRQANADGNALALVIAERGAWSKPIGVIGFQVAAGSGGAVASGGYHLAPEHWDQGYASEAMAGLVPMIRLLTRIARLTASVMPDNTASARVLVKNGFRKTGSGAAKTEHRGTFTLDHYARDLRLIGEVAGPHRRERPAAAPQAHACA